MTTRTTAARGRDDVLRWRRDQLLAAGFQPRAAHAVARNHHYDLHALIELVEHGCPPHLAVRILRPLEEESAA